MGLHQATGSLLQDANEADEIGSGAPCMPPPHQRADGHPKWIYGCARDTTGSSGSCAWSTRGRLWGTRLPLSRPRMRRCGLRRSRSPRSARIGASLVPRRSGLTTSTSSLRAPMRRRLKRWSTAKPTSGRPHTHTHTHDGPIPPLRSAAGLLLSLCQAAGAPARVRACTPKHGAQPVAEGPPFCPHRPHRLQLCQPADELTDQHRVSLEAAAS